MRSWWRTFETAELEAERGEGEPIEGLVRAAADGLARGAEVVAVDVDLLTCAEGVVVGGGVTGAVVAVLLVAVVEAVVFEVGVGVLGLVDGGWLGAERVEAAVVVVRVVRIVVEAAVMAPVVEEVVAVVVFVEAATAAEAE